MVNSAGSSGIFQPLEGDDPKAVAGYRLTAKLGSGGMGKVYLSYTPGGRPVAIKVIRPEFSEDNEFRRRFKQEVQSAQRVQGLFTAPVIDSDPDGTSPWLATAYVPGPSLSAAVAEHGKLPVPTVLLLVAGIAEALQVIHGAGIVHRDLKPSNVLLAADGPRVIDFGIARAADATSLTSSGVTVGTPTFMAPEQAAGSTVTPATDIFALGQVAAYAAIGTPAFGEGTSHGVLYRIVHEDPDLTGLPDELRELVTRCLAKDAAQRPSVAEVIALCGEASGQTQLRRPEDWLPTAVAADITTRTAAPAPVQAPPPPVEAPTAQLAAPQAAPQAPAQPPAPPAATVPNHPQTPPPGFGPAAQEPTANVTAPLTQVAGAPAPAPAPAPAGPTAAVPAAQPPKKKRKGLVTALVLVCMLAFAGAGGTAVYYVMKGDGQKAKNQADAKGTKGNPKKTQNSDASGGATGGSTASPGTDGGGSGSDAPVKDPEPVDSKDFDLSDDYHLTFSDDPLKAKSSDDGDVDFVYNDNEFTDDTVSTSTGKMVLLDSGEQGSLDVCRSETRFTTTISSKRLTKGSQICLTTKYGALALITYKGSAPGTSPSRYITIDVRVWRNAVEPEQS
ncbi:serine/threonine-protein kinase [Streptomyces chattanoogensis]|uniref:Serine/threonine protein kinase n=1 Tax=Streptomyces chattanoogensis TaxID=66876 RepID=A0A0N1JYK8_9ACTN|nr:serine/threonine-protein kinase [Streptomyces chattanoogensis]KPC63856.1 serine/threonine protein kinase [Streptomyces chattanoogensis]